MNLQDIKKEQHQANSQLFQECGIFWAFSDQQFKEQAKPLQEGDKYVRLLGGGFCPKSNVDKLLNGLEANRKAYKQQIKAHNLRVREIAYELANHECFYTGNWSVVADMFPDVAPEVIQRIYRRELKKQN